MTIEIEYQRAVTEAAALRMEGATAMAVLTGKATKVAASESAGVSRPTLDRWIASTEAGHTLTVDWDDKPDSVSLDGITVDVLETTIYLPSESTINAADSAGRGWELSIGESVIDTTRGYDDLRHTIITPGGVIVFQPAYLDAAVVYLVRKEQARRAGVADQRAAHDRAISELTAMQAAIAALVTPEQKQGINGGPGLIQQRETLAHTAQAYYDQGILAEDEARAYAGWRLK